MEQQGGKRAVGFVGQSAPAENRGERRDEHRPEQRANTSRREDEMKVSEQAADVAVVDDAVDRRTQQRRLQSIGDTAEQRHNAKQGARQRQPPCTHAGDARGIGGGIQAVDDPGQQQDDQQVRHGERMSCAATASQATSSDALILPPPHNNLLSFYRKHGRPPA